MSVNKEKTIYPYQDWQVSENEFSKENNKRSETIFALANGYLGLRGNFEEGYPKAEDNTMQGTYINGFYETSAIEYGETAYGFPETGQTMLNVTDSKIIKLYIDGEEFNLFNGEVVDYQRSLNFKTGILTRSVVWENNQGKRIKIKINRLVSFTNKNLIVINYNFKPLNFSGKIRVVSALDGDVSNYQAEGDPRAEAAVKGKPLKVVAKKQSQKSALLKQKVKNTGFDLVCGMKNVFKTEQEYETKLKEEEKELITEFELEASVDEWVSLNKYITYYTNLDAESNLLAKAKKNLNDSSQKDFAWWAKQQKDYLRDFWQQADVEIKGDKALQQGIRFNQFHLLQSVGKDGKTNIAAKGLTGEGYEGHYFWDTEIYILPFFLYNRPEISKKLLEYRYNILDNARERARELAHEQGALYPWRTIGGDECSAYYPASTAQYHINADIIYALKEYVDATGDIEFLVDMGAEMTFETARVWYDLGHFNQRLAGKFCIDGVTGPDEYTAIVDNNCYTNYMAKLNLEYAVKVAELLKEEYPKEYQDLIKKIDLEAVEINNWKKAADKMYLPYDEELGIHPQDDKFLDLKVWDLENTPEDKFPLLLNYHPLVIYRHQVCKQADLVLALYLLGDEFSQAEKKRDFDYYDQITTHDSSLSTSIYSIIASEIGYKEKAYDYFMETVRTDLDDKHGNSAHGVHTACMAGSWLAIASGFAGFRVYDGELNLNPYLPEQWDSYKFKLTFKGSVLEIEVKEKEVIYSLVEGEKIEFYHQGEKMKLTREDKRVKINL